MSKKGVVIEVRVAVAGLVIILSLTRIFELTRPPVEKFIVANYVKRN